MGVRTCSPARKLDEGMALRPATSGLGCPLAVSGETCSYPTGMTRMVKCAKLGETLPALPYKPFNDALGQRIYDSVSAEAWRQWIEHSKKLVNEYRLDLTQKKAHDILKEQCEAFLFGDGGQLPPDYVPEQH